MGWIFDYQSHPKNKYLRKQAQQLRKNGIPSEVIFWQACKQKLLLGFDIDRQSIIGNYIVDFFIPELGLIFEIDGQSHDFKSKSDVEREKYLQTLGLEIVHFTDLEVKKITSVHPSRREFWI
jgi:very-short-patch-repair endonuclease